MRRPRARHRISMGEGAAKGALAGVAGGLAVFASHELEARGLLPGADDGRGAGRRRRQPAIRRGIRRVARKQGVTLRGSRLALTELGLQLAAGAVVGAVYGALQARFTLPAAAHAAVLGGIAYAGTTWGLLPAIGGVQPKEMTLKDALVPAGAHAVFALTTARVFTAIADSD